MWIVARIMVISNKPKPNSIKVLYQSDTRLFYFDSNIQIVLTPPQTFKLASNMYQITTILDK